MYVWRGVSHRDRSRGRSGWRPGVARHREILAEKRQVIEDHEVRVKTKHIAGLCEEYLETAAGRLELLAVGEALRKEQDLLEEKNKEDDDDEGRVKACFDVFDADGSGCIDSEELGNLLKELCVPVKDANELAELLGELDVDGSGEIDFQEFHTWYAANAESRKKGVVGGVKTAALQVAKLGRAVAGVSRMLEAKRVIIACAEDDAAQYARLVFRQSRPSDDSKKKTPVVVEVDWNAEKRFSCVRAVLGRPMDVQNEGEDLDSRGYRARRQIFHPDLWQLPPPDPSILPPTSMNAEAPHLADPEDSAGDALDGGAFIQGFDPSGGFRGSGPRTLFGLKDLGHSGAYLNESVARAITALRNDVATGQRPGRHELGHVEVVPPGKARATVYFAWTPEMRPRPKREVIVQGEFSGWRPRRLGPSRREGLLGTYDIALELPPGTYAYNYRVDGGKRALVDETKPVRGDGSQRRNMLFVVACHQKKKNGDAGVMKAELDIDLPCVGLRDDGAWALAAAIRHGGGGGRLRRLLLPGTVISGDGVAALGAAIACGAARCLEVVDLSRNPLGAPGGAAIGTSLRTRRDPKDRSWIRPAPLRQLRLDRCGLGDDGAMHVASGLVGHDTLEILHLDENNIGELGAAALAKGLLRNGSLTSLGLAGNRLDPPAATHLAGPIRLSGSLKRLELANNPTLGPLGAAALAEALAGGSHDLVVRLERERDTPSSQRTKHKSLAELGAMGVGSETESSDDEEEGRRRGPSGLLMTRTGSLEHLGLAKCGVMRSDNRQGIFALCNGISRGGALNSLDLRENEMTDWAAKELARVLADNRGKNRLAEIQLDGNPLLRREWFWRDFYGFREDEPKKKNQDDEPPLPSIATSLETNRRAAVQRRKDEEKAAKDQAAAELLRKMQQEDEDDDATTLSSFPSIQPQRRRSSLKKPPRRKVAPVKSKKKKDLMAIVDPPPNGDPKTCKLEGEWTAMKEWYPLADKRAVRAARKEDRARTREARRQTLEEDVVKAAGAAAGALALQAARKVPDGPRLVTAVADEVKINFTRPRAVAPVKTSPPPRKRRRWWCPLDLRSKMQQDKDDAEEREAERDRVQDTFRLVDVDDSGSVDAEELYPLLVRMGWTTATQKDARTALDSLDADGSGAVDFDELIEWWLDGDGAKVRKMIDRRRRRWGKKRNEDEAQEQAVLMDLELRRDALRLIEADARYDAEITARSDFRQKRAPREGCVCEVCGLASVDASAAKRHTARATRRKKNVHEAWSRMETAAYQRKAMIERARQVVAEMAAIHERRSSSSKGARFPVLLCYDARVPPHVELQTYDIPDPEKGRPTGAANLHSGALYCVGDGYGSIHVPKGTLGTEWLRILWPSHQLDDVEKRSAAAVTTAEAMKTALNSTASTVVSLSSLSNTGATKRPVVWLHNRSPEYGRNKKPVLRPLKCGPSPYSPQEDDDVKDKQLQKELAEAEDRDTFLGDDAVYVLRQSSLTQGTEVVLLSRPRWYRTAPALPVTVRLKGRVIPESHAAVIGEVIWGQAILVYGVAGDWLVAAFEDRDAVWFLSRSPNRAFFHPVVSAVELRNLKYDALQSPVVVELGGMSPDPIPSSSDALHPKPLALTAQDLHVDDATLLALGGANQTSA